MSDMSQPLRRSRRIQGTSALPLRLGVPRPCAPPLSWDARGTTIRQVTLSAMPLFIAASYELLARRHMFVHGPLPLDTPRPLCEVSLCRTGCHARGVSTTLLQRTWGAIQVLTIRGPPPPDADGGRPERALTTNWGNRAAAAAAVDRPGHKSRSAHTAATEEGIMCHIRVNDLQVRVATMIDDKGKRAIVPINPKVFFFLVSESSSAGYMKPPRT